MFFYLRGEAYVFESGDGALLVLVKSDGEDFAVFRKSYCVASACRYCDDIFPIFDFALTVSVISHGNAGAVLAESHRVVISRRDSAYSVPA